MKSRAIIMSLVLPIALIPTISKADTHEVTSVDSSSTGWFYSVSHLFQATADDSKDPREDFHVGPTYEESLVSDKDFRTRLDDNAQSKHEQLDRFKELRVEGSNHKRADEDRVFIKTVKGYQTTTAE